MGRRNIRPPLAGGGPARSGELFRRGPFSDGLDHIFGENRGRRSAQNFSPPRARSLALALNTHYSARLHACTPAPGLGNYGGLCRPVERGCRSHRRHGPFWPCPAEARGVDDSKLVPRTRLSSPSQGPVCKARPKAPYTMQKLVPKPDRATASLVGDFPRPGAVWAMPTRTRSVDHGLARPPKILCVSRDTLVVGGHF